MVRCRFTVFITMKIDRKWWPNIYKNMCTQTKFKAAEYTYYITDKKMFYKWAQLKKAITSNKNVVNTINYLKK